jgi:uncharacterized repeat protein (TIGR04138 family)
MSNSPDYSRVLQGVAEDVGLYPLDAYQFVQLGLHFTSEKIHGVDHVTRQTQDRHVTGQQLCEGLRDFAIDQYGMLAGAVLRHWHIESTYDFGRIVWAMVDSGLLAKRDEDSLEDFRNIYDFADVFEGECRIEARV